MKALWLTLLCTLLLVPHAASGPMCYDCERVPFPRDCGHVAVCGDAEVCVTRQIISDSGVVWYNQRCQPRERCVHIRQRYVTGDTYDETGDVTICEECCIGDFCNVHGCGTQPLLPLASRGPICFNCKQQLSHDTCDLVTVCGHDEMCILTSSVMGSGDLVYETGCQSKHVCDLTQHTFVGRRDVTGMCSGCCDTDYCNRNCVSLHQHQTQHPSATAGTPAPTSHPDLSSSPSPGTPAPTYPASSAASASPTALPSTTTAAAVREQEALCRQMGYNYSTQFNTCYKLFTDKALPWQASRDRCRQDGGDLLVLRSEEEEQFMQGLELQLIADSNKIKFWVGATNSYIEGGWVWLDGSPVPDALWHPDEPNNVANLENCAAMMFYWMDNTANLNDFRCDWSANFICEVNLTGVELPVSLSISVAGRCHERGYTYNSLSGICYKAYTNPVLTYDLARRKCQSEHAELLTLNDVTEERAIIGDRFYDHSNSHRYWVGGHRQSDGSFHWLNGQSISSEFAWNPGEPNNYGGNENCVAFTYSQNFTFNDVDCNSLLYYICEAQDLKTPRVQCHNSEYKYIPETGTCFHVYQRPAKNYPEARRKCQSERADLIMLKNVQLEHIIQNEHFYDTIFDHRYWVGAYRAQGSSFYWLNGQPVSSDRDWWNPSEPNNYMLNETCVSLTYNSGLALNDDNCYKDLYYICEEKCPDASYTYVPGLDLCFKIYAENATWDEAQARCHDDKAQLAEPRDLATFTYLQRVLDKMTLTGEEKYWVGITDEGHVHRFTWVTSRDAIPSSYWHIGEPSILRSNEHCAGLWRFSIEPTLLLNDAPCDTKSYYICENIW